MEGGPQRWADACLAASLMAVARCRLGGCLGGLWVICRAGPVRARFLEEASGILEGAARVPPGTVPERLLGGLDLAATLSTGRPVNMPGLLDRNVPLILPMAERVDAGLAALIGQAMDRRGTQVVALDERAEPEEALPPILADRLGLVVTLDGLAAGDCLAPMPDEEEIVEARARFAHVMFPEDLREGLAAASLGFGCGQRAALQADIAARASASLAGMDEVDEEAVAAALRLVLVPRATRLPGPPEEPEAEQQPDAEPPPDQDPAEPSQQQALPEEMLVDATEAAMPEALLASLMAGETSRAVGRGGKGAERSKALRGRPAGVRPGKPDGGRRLDIGATLRAAAPWQKVRGRKPGAPVAIRADDFRIAHFKERAETLTIFTVDASGSAAMARLAEAKGAVELMLAEAYRRRDHVAVIGFRGQGAELLLPPTRALARAKRSLGGLPGGGGTPLAAGLSEALTLALTAQRRGQTVAVIVLTDGRANIALDPEAPKAVASTDAEQMARAICAAGLSALLIDTSRRPRDEAAALAGTMGARYLPMPNAGSAALSAVVDTLS